VKSIEVEGLPASQPAKAKRSILSAAIRR